MSAHTATDIQKLGIRLLVILCLTIGSLPVAAAAQPASSTQGATALMSAEGLIAIGYEHSCALTTDGDADCWGTSRPGIGDSQAGPYSTISAAWEHTCALTVDGAADCWGANWAGQSDDQPGPYTTLVAGSDYTCAVTESGAVDCWGANWVGRADDQPGPYTSIALGWEHTCALAVDGAVDCWGANWAGQSDDQPGPYATPMRLTSWLPAANPAGWHRTPVTLTYACQGGLRPECPAQDEVTVDGAGQQVTATASDLRGSVAVRNTINLDTNDPTATLDSPTGHGSLTGTATDGLSGVDTVTLILSPAIGDAADQEFGATLDCTDQRRPDSCTWTVDVPVGVWHVTLRPVDIAGNPTTLSAGAAVVLP